MLSSCTALKSSFRGAQPVGNSSAGKQTGPFIEGIEIQPVATKVATRSGSSGKTAAQQLGNQLAGTAASLEFFSINQFKYALRLDVPVELIQNRFLYDFIDDWWKTPYRLGGTSRNGIDCSAFVQTLMLSVFGLQLPRTAREQKEVTDRIRDTDLQEGDLLFFNTGRGISHVGIYLHNNKFVHASTSGGVMISDLAETYWNRRYLYAGRLLQLIRP